MADFMRFWRQILKSLACRQLAARRKRCRSPRSSRLFGPRSSDVNVLVIERAQHRYVFIFTDEHVTEILRTAGRFADDSDLNFNWTDANKIAKILQNS